MFGNASWSKGAFCGAAVRLNVLVRDADGCNVTKSVARTVSTKTSSDTMLPGLVASSPVILPGPPDARPARFVTRKLACAGTRSAMRNVLPITNPGKARGEGAKVTHTLNEKGRRERVR